jgi:hypothetical protein
MSSTRQLHRFYGLFPTLVLDRETEEMMHDEGLLARFWGAWFDSCMTCWSAMVWDAAQENPLIELMDNISRNMAMGMGRPMMRTEARHG